MAELKSNKPSNQNKTVSQKAIKKLLSNVTDEQLTEFKNSDAYNKKFIEKATALINSRNKNIKKTAKSRLRETKTAKSRLRETKTEISEKISDDFDPESIEFEGDMENGKYEHWIAKYPEHLQEIFEGLINLGYDELFTYSCIYGFIERGIDINKNGDYRSDCGGTTPLGHACEFRKYLLIRSLLENGADPNLADEHGMTPLDSVISGHSPDDTIGIMTNALKIKEMILILQEFGVNLVVKNWIMKENFDENDDYINMPKDEFFVNFVADVQRNFDDKLNEKVL